MSRRAACSWSIRPDKDSLVVRVSVPPGTREQSLHIQATGCKVCVAVEGLEDRSAAKISLPTHLRIKPREVDARYRSRSGVLVLRFPRQSALHQRALDLRKSEPRSSSLVHKEAAVAHQRIVGRVEEADRMKGNKHTSCPKPHQEAQQARAGPLRTSMDARKELSELDKAPEPPTSHECLHARPGCSGLESARKCPSAQKPSTVPRTADQPVEAPIVSLSDLPPTLVNRTATLEADSSNPVGERDRPTDCLEQRLHDFLGTADHDQMLWVLRRIRQLYLRRTADPRTFWRKMLRARHDKHFAASFLRLMVEAVFVQGVAERDTRRRRLETIIAQSMNRHTAGRKRRHDANQQWDDRAQRMVAERIGAECERNLALIQDSEAAKATALAARKHERRTRKLQRLAWETALARHALESSAPRPTPVPKRMVNKSEKGKRRGAANVTFLLEDEQIHFPV